MLRIVLAAGKSTRFEIGGPEIYLHEDVARILHVLFRIKACNKIAQVCLIHLQGMKEELFQADHLLVKLQH